MFKLACKTYARGFIQGLVSFTIAYTVSFAFSALIGGKGASIKSKGA